MSEAELTWEKIGRCGVITLDRPRALNALSFAMVGAMTDALDAFARDPEVQSVVMRSASPKAFCAGADIKHVAELGKAGRHTEQLAFFAAEYQNCRRIKSYPKPYVALIDGIVMGGGAGIAINGAHRVVGDTVSFAMPEVGIGFFPDVGASYFLSRLPAKLGTYLAVTGARAALGDVVALGLGTAYVPTSHFGALFEQLVAGETPERAIKAQAVAPPASALLKERDLIARSFAAPDIATILAATEAESAGSAFAAQTLSVLCARSPTSMAIALRQMQLGGALDFDEALVMEFGIVSRIIHSHDFYEGVRATLIDKDQTPHWRPASITDIAAAQIDSYFAPLAPEHAFGIAAPA